MPAGALRERIKFERRKQVPNDGYGNRRAQWERLTNDMAAAIEPARPREEVLAQRLAGVVNWIIIVRNCAETRAVTSTDRAVDVRSGRTFNISPPVNVDLHRQYFEIPATSGGADG